MDPKATSPKKYAFYIHLASIVQAAFILLILTYPITGNTAIFACQSGEAVIFQDRPCPQKKPQANTQKTNYRFPLSIHESWFELPAQAEERAFCDRRGCECGRLEKMHQDSLIQSVADALYLDGSWHRYDAAYQAWMQSPASSSESFDLREQMLEASCEIMMSQVLLRNYADDAVVILKKRVRTAEERGYDVELPCLQGIPEACAFYESVQLLTRLRQDASALKEERVESTLPGRELLSSSELSSDP